MLGYEFIIAIPVLLVTIYGLYEYALPRHPRAAITALVLLTAILIADISLLAYHLSRLPFTD